MTSQDQKLQQEKLFKEVGNFKTINDATLLKSLLDETNDFNPINNEGNTLLHKAVCISFVKSELLVKDKRTSNSINQPNNKGNTPLHSAVLVDHEDISPEIIALLLAHDAKVNIRNNEGKTPLDIIKESNPSTKEAKLTLEKLAKAAGVPVEDDKTQKLNEDLRDSIFSNENSQPQDLIETGANINMSDRRLRNLFHEAVLRNKVEIIKDLASLGADINSEDIEGNTSLHLAAKHGTPEMVKALISNGADLNKQNLQGNIPLHLAAARKDIPELIINLLIARDAGTQIDQQNYNGQTPYNYMKHHSRNILNSKVVASLLTEKVTPQYKGDSKTMPENFSTKRRFPDREV